MATKSGDERLAELIREHLEQNEEWERVKATIASFGDVTLAIPTELLDQVEDACTVQTSAMSTQFGIRA